MELKGKAAALRVIVGESDKVHGKPFYEELVRTARELNLAGATVTRGIMGYGGNSRIHIAKIERLSEDLPLVIEIVDEAEDIGKILPWIEANLINGIVYTAPCDVRVYRHGK